MFGNDTTQSDTGNTATPADASHNNTAFPPVGTPAPLPQAEPSGPPITLPSPHPPADESVNHMTLDDLATTVGASQQAAEPEETPAISPEPVAASTPAAPDANDLLGIKQQALQNLTPLVGQLEQTPLEKFKTTMMMIQASDDQSLIKTAYDAAEQITDEKEKAQALLDIVNEINYFTQHAEE